MPADLNSFISGARSIAGSAANTLGTITNTVNTLKTQGFGAALRSVNLLPGGEAGRNSNPASAIFSSSSSRDWRVRLSLPTNPAYRSSSIMRPLIETNGMVFPYTPSISIAHSASYQSMSPVHNNYPFLSYENSKVDAMTITGQFFCEDAVEAAYWVAAVHFLKSVTKMSFGADTNAGAPPPVLKLNGYGDYVFKDVPVVVTNFTIELPNDVDYISTGLSANAPSNINKVSSVVTAVTGIQLPLPSLGQGVAWAPVKSQFTVIVQPLYSREQVRNFSLDKFIKGDYVLGSGGSKTGFI
jgi:hypothetical protein